MKIYQSKTFARKVRKFNQRDKNQLDKEIKKIMENPSSTGTEKKGDLQGVFVHKFHLHNQLFLLAYRFTSKEALELIMIGPHENYYRDLKKRLRTT